LNYQNHDSDLQNKDYYHYFSNNFIAKTNLKFVAFYPN